MANQRLRPGTWSIVNSGASTGCGLLSKSGRINLKRFHMKMALVVVCFQSQVE